MNEKAVETGAKALSRLQYEQAGMGALLWWEMDSTDLNRDFARVVLEEALPETKQAKDLRELQVQVRNVLRVVAAWLPSGDDRYYSEYDDAKKTCARTMLDALDPENAQDGCWLVQDLLTRWSKVDAKNVGRG